MWLRRVFYGWLLPAGLVLPLWLLVGWGIFQAGAWAFLWVLFIAVPSVLVGQLVLAMLVRARPTVRAERAVSWWDVAGFAVWHALTIAVGFYSPAWFVPSLVGAIVAGLALIWLSLFQLWNEARAHGSGILLRYSAAASAGPSGARSRIPDAERAHPPGVVIVEESRSPGKSSRS